MKKMHFLLDFSQIVFRSLYSPFVNDESSFLYIFSRTINKIYTKLPEEFIKYKLKVDLNAKRITKKQILSELSKYEIKFILAKEYKAKEKRYRNKIDENYKANRIEHYNKNKEKISNAFKIANDFILLYPWKYYELCVDSTESLEADDLIVKYVLEKYNEKDVFIIISDDSDLEHLLTLKNVFIYKIKKGEFTNKDSLTFHPLVKLYEKIIFGDKSDNINNSCITAEKRILKKPILNYMSAYFNNVRNIESQYKSGYYFKFENVFKTVKKSIEKANKNYKINKEQLYKNAQLVLPVLNFNVKAKEKINTDINKYIDFMRGMKINNIPLP